MVIVCNRCQIVAVTSTSALIFDTKFSYVPIINYLKNEIN